MNPRKRERSTELIVNFVDGFADGWFMAVKESFKEELDIKLTERKESKISILVWTQGPDFCFSEGQTFYDSCQSYGEWKTAMKHINIACQIVEAKPNMYVKHTDELTGEKSSMTHQGYVKFVLYKPNDNRDGLTAFIGYHLTQNQFVKFLQYGDLERTV